MMPVGMNVQYDDFGSPLEFFDFFLGEMATAQPQGVVKPTNR